MSVDLEKLNGYSSLEFKAKQIVEGFLSGLHKSPFHGFSVEFADYRAYNTGEDTRYVDWKLFARTDKLFIKNFEQETNLRCLIAIDCSSSMFFPFERKEVSLDNPDKMTYAVCSAAALVSMLYSQRDAFGLSFLSDKIDFISGIKSSFAHKRYVFSLLENLIAEKPKEKKNTFLSPLIHQLAGQVHKRSLIVIFTDLFSLEDNEEEFIKSLRHLRYNKHEVILFHCIDKKYEQDFLFKNRPYKFIDAETGEEIKVNPSEIRAAYQESVRQRFETIRQACMGMRVDYAECDINKSIDQVLLPYFIKRVRMRA
ncbi:MAG: DUF58 domain-containing protein [Bacteroidales bacterium]|nr:DUF58 domain-containing protein [Bacteroidales bacterium]